VGGSPPPPNRAPGYWPSRPFTIPRRGDTPVLPRGGIGYALFAGERHRANIGGRLSTTQAQAGDDRAEPRRQAAVGGQPGAGEDQQQTHHGSGGHGLAEDRDTERQRDHGIDVGDDRRPARAHLGDQSEEEEERERRADEAEHGYRRERLRRRSGLRQVGGRERRDEEGGDSERSGHRAERIDVGEPALDDHRSDRVTDRREEDGARAGQLGAAAADVDADEARHSGEADQ